MYTSYYGLDRKPFENTPDPDFLYLSEKHREVLASLMYGIDSEKGFIMIVGDVGTGKTTLIQTVLRNIEQSSSIVLHIINPRPAFKEMLVHLSKKLNLKVENQSTFELLDQLKIKLEKFSEKGRKILLIIDEAHHLSEESLEDIRLLSNLENHNKKLIQIILAGQNELYRTLEKKSLRQLWQRIVIYRVLERLNRKELYEYVAHRLKIAGMENLVFNRRALSLIWKKSKGIPRVINQLCDSSLLLGYAMNKPVIGSRIIKEVIADSERKPVEYRAVPKKMKLLHTWMPIPAILAIAVFTFFLVSGGFFPIQKTGSIKQAEIMGNSITKSIVPVSSTENMLDENVKPISPKINMFIPYSNRTNGDNNRAGEFFVPVINSFSPPLELNPSRYYIISHDFTLAGKKEQNEEKDTAEKKEENKENVSTAIEEIRPSPLFFASSARGAHDIKNFFENLSGKSWTVSTGEYLIHIAMLNYGIFNDTIMDLIQAANPNLKDPNYIYPGQIITLPEINKYDLILQNEKKEFFIYYATFHDFQKSQQTLQYLSNKKIKGFRMVEAQGDNQIYRIYIGFFESYEKAVEILENIECEHLVFVNN